MKNPAFYRPTVVMVNLKAIQQNIKSLKKYLDSKTAVIAVVKADGYGHGEIEVAKAVLDAGAEMVSVATPDEALRLRVGGVKGDILVMGPSPVSFADKAASLGITVTVSDGNWLQEVIDNNKYLKKPLKIHVKIDSGMGRIGLRDGKALLYLITVAERSEHIIIDGVFTHFSCADQPDSKITEKDFLRFMDLVSQFPEKPRLIHASNSAATLLYPKFALDAVRFGISLYGISPSDYVENNLPFKLEKSFVLKSELAFVKLLEKGNTISYGATYETAEDEWIGTIPIGYADGLRRSLRGQEVLISGKRMPIVGTICMDQCMVRLSGEFPVGEEVVLIGKQGEDEITIEEWARRLDTIPYEVLVSIAKRVPRLYCTVDKLR